MPHGYDDVYDDDSVKGYDDDGWDGFPGDDGMASGIDFLECGEDDSVKGGDDRDGCGVKEGEDGFCQSVVCPYCGSRFDVRPSGGLVFCGVCHRRMPWIVIGDVPVKEFGS